MLVIDTLLSTKKAESAGGRNRSADDDDDDDDDDNDDDCPSRYKTNTFFVYAVVSSMAKGKVES